jgi:hypothetical protein
MSFASKVLYTGNGVTTQYNIPFPYISASHVNVYVNETLMLDPMNYSQSGSTITFSDAPEEDAAILIKRNTSPTATLVDFTDGSVLGETELNTAYLHNYYLLQEATDSLMVTDHQHVQVFVDGINRERPSRVGRTGQHVRYAADLDNIRCMSTARAFSMVDHNDRCRM